MERVQREEGDLQPAPSASPPGGDAVALAGHAGDPAARSMHRCTTDSRARSVDPAFEVRLTWAGLVLTGVSAALVCRHAGGEILRAAAAGAHGRVVLESLVLAVILSLIYGSVVYQLSRRGHFLRMARHRPPRLSEIWRRLAKRAPLVTILVPSYKEEARVVHASLLSAALQHYPRRRVVLLIDDPPVPATDADRRTLAEARDLPHRVTALLAPARERFTAASAEVESRLGAGRAADRRDGERLASLYHEAARWFEEQAVAYPVADHADALFVQVTFRDRAAYFHHQARALKRAGRPSARTLLRGYRELATVFDVEVTSFERKRYENVSHAPNKAMNLNSYIALAGKRVHEVERGGRLHLEEDAAGEPIPDPAYFVTLDADSILAPDYVLRLVDVMERPGSHVGVIQTPYSAFPSAPGLLERIAGATTDVQHIVHQGFSAHGATFWVGANAVLRTSALRDIAVAGEERGHPVVRYIQDRTVIEDTESSIDLLRRGWQLVNYPERLSYSATPPDFGSLLIQRRRWANGGLLIVPKLLGHIGRQLTRAGLSRGLLVETLLRFHYLVSLATANLGLLLLLCLPAPKSFFTLWLPLTALPYYALYGRDLVQAGYRLADLFRVYALNLLLVPVHVGGVLKSLEQAWTGRQIPFHRTPKVAERTALPLGYVAGAVGLLLFLLTGACVDLLNGRALNACFAFLNGGFLAYAMTALMTPSDVAISLAANETLRALRDAWRTAEARTAVAISGQA